MNISAAGLDLIKKHEGLSLVSYQDGGGVWTVGFGHTGSNVYAGQHITQEQADAFLAADMIIAEKCVNNSVRVDMTQNQFDALCSFTENLGCSALGRSTLLYRLNGSDDEGAAKEFLKWDHDNGKVVPGLLVRRTDEMNLFLS